VASDVGGNPELVDHGETGLLFPSNDVAALEHALEPLVERADTRQAMGLKGRARAARHFSLQAMIHGYERLYRQCYLAKTGRHSARHWCHTQ
jgi:glycosyltransferase involved in cell wall biosynthesis